MVQYSGRVLHANIMEIEEEVRDSTECLLMKVKVERMKTLTTTRSLPQPAWTAHLMYYQLAHLSAAPNVTYNPPFQTIAS